VTDQAQVLKKMVIPLENLIETICALDQEFRLALILVGDRTYSKNIRKMLTSFELQVVTVNEDKSSLEGRYRYLKENTRGLTRLIPIGLRIPRRPFDDYVAVVLAERYLKNNPNILGDK
jgi:hypothetical protein